MPVEEDTPRSAPASGEPAARSPNREHEAMPEGEEAPPRGVKVMGAVRWAILAMTVIVAVASWWSLARAYARGGDASMQAAPTYHCPMHPQIVSREPGECPICHMNLEPIADRVTAPPPASGTDAGTATPARPTAPATSMGAQIPASPGAAPGSTPTGTAPITLTLDRIQAIGVRTAIAEEQDVNRVLRVTAVVAPTEQGVTEVHVRSAGFVERAPVDQTGVSVAKGQPLLEVYSPEIFQAQSELLAASQWATRDGSSRSVDASRTKLELLGMSARDIDRVLEKNEATRAILIYAPQAGVITKKSVRRGAYVTPEMPLYEITDLSRLYVVADVFQQDVSSLRVGTEGRFVPEGDASLAATARIDLVYPAVDVEARTTRVRMQIRNAKAQLRPGDYGNVEFTLPARKALLVPRDAVVDMGEATYVFVALGEGRFSPRSVVVGRESASQIVIQAGLGPGDRVVSGATFLIDSESRLQASAAQTAQAADASSPAR